MLRPYTPNDWASNATKHMGSFLSDLLPSALEQTLSIKDLKSYRGNEASTNTLLKPEFPARHNIVVQQVHPNDSNQAMKNLKTFYKKCLETDLKSRRMKFMSSRQRKRGDKSLEYSGRTQHNDIDKLAETNISLFKNMNDLFTADCSFRRVKNNQPPLYKAENEIIQSYNRGLSSKRKKEKFTILNPRSDTVYIPMGVSNVDDKEGDSRLNVTSRFHSQELNHSPDKSLLHQNFIPMVSQNPVLVTRFKSFKQHDYLKERKAKKSDFFLNRTFCSKDYQNIISVEDVANKSFENRFQSPERRSSEANEKTLRAVSAKATIRSASIPDEVPSVNRSRRAKTSAQNAHGSQKDNSSTRTYALYNPTVINNSPPKREKRSSSTTASPIKTLTLVLNS